METTADQSHQEKILRHHRMSKYTGNICRIYLNIKKKREEKYRNLDEYIIQYSELLQIDP